MFKSLGEQKASLLESLHKIIIYIDDDIRSFAKRVGTTREFIYSLFSEKGTEFTFERIIDYFAIYDYSLKIVVQKEGEEAKGFLNADSKKTISELIDFLKNAIIEEEGSLKKFNDKLGFSGYYITLLFNGTKKFTCERLFDYLVMYGYSIDIGFTRINNKINLNEIKS